MGNTVTGFLALLLSGKSAVSCVFDTVAGVDDTDPHLLQSLAIHFWDRGLPSRHLVAPSIQSTPPCREQQPLQSAYAGIVNREIVSRMDMKRVNFFILLSSIYGFPGAVSTICQL